MPINLQLHALYYGTDNILGSKHLYGFIFIPVTNCVNLNPHTSISVTMKTLSPTSLNLTSKEFGSSTHTQRHCLFWRQWRCFMLNSETAEILMVSSLINTQNYSWVVIILREVFVEESCKAVIPIRRTPKPLKLM